MSDEPDGLLTPWYYLGSVTITRRLQVDNPAVLSAMADSLDPTWEDLLRGLVDQGATDDEIWAGGWKQLLPIPVRRYLEATLTHLRGDIARTPAPPVMTEHQREKITEVSAAVTRLRRTNRRGATKSAVATAIGVDRGTLATWIKRGWVTLDD